MEDLRKKRNHVENLKHGFSLWYKPMRMFRLHLVCVYLIILAPIALHHVYACLIGAHSIFLRGNYTFGFFSDVLEFCLLLIGWAEYASTAVRTSRLALCAVSLVSTAFAWSLCAHVAASCLVSTQPSLKHSLQVASSAFPRVAYTAVAAIVPIIIVIFSLVAFFLAFFLAYNGTEAPWIPRLELSTENAFNDPAVQFFLTCFFSLELVAVELLVCPRFSLSLVAAAVGRNTYGFSALRESAKLSIGLFSFLICSMAINAIPYNYQDFAEAVKHQDVAGILWAVLFVAYMVFLKVMTIFFICIVYFHARTAPVEEHDGVGKKRWFIAKISEDPFDADDKSLMYCIVTDFDNSIKDDTSGFLLNGLDKN